MTASKREEIIKKLSAVDVKPFLKEKMKLSYLSWADAWRILTGLYPNSTYEIKEYPQFKVMDGKAVQIGTTDYRLTNAGCEVSVTVNIEGEKFSMSLYVRDSRNKAVKQPDYAQINKTQMRCLVKAIALAGLGLNVYAGEDIPTDESLKRNGVDKESQQKQIELKAKRQTFMKMLSQASGGDKKLAQMYQQRAQKVAGEMDATFSAMEPLQKATLMIKALNKVVAEQEQAQQEAEGASNETEFPI